MGAASRRPWGRALVWAIAIFSVTYWGVCFVLASQHDGPTLYYRLYGSAGDVIGPNRAGLWLLLGWIPGVLAAAISAAVILIRGKPIGLGAPIAGILLVVGAYAYFAIEAQTYSRKLDAATRAQADQRGIREGVPSLRRGEAETYIRDHQKPTVTTTLLQGIEVRLRPTQVEDWSDSDWRGFASLAERALQSERELDRTLGSKITAAVLYRYAVPGGVSGAVTECPDEHCIKRFAELFLDDENPHFLTRSWTLTDIEAATRGVSYPKGRERSAAARLLSEAVQPGEVCTMLRVCRDVQCNSWSLLALFLERLESDPGTAWRAEDAECLGRFLPQSGFRNSDRAAAESLEFWINRVR